MRRRLEDAAVRDGDPLQPDCSWYKNGTLYVAGRGPRPLSAVKVSNYNSAASPALYTFTLSECTQVSLESNDLHLEMDASHTVLEYPDPHGGSIVDDDEV